MVGQSKQMVIKIVKKKKKVKDFPGGPVVHCVLPMQGAWL